MNGSWEFDLKKHSQPWEKIKIFKTSQTEGKIQFQYTIFYQDVVVKYKYITR